MCTPVVFKVLKKANHYFFFWLFKLYTPVNSYGNVGTASSLNHTFSQHKLTSTSRLDQAFYKENKKDNCYMTSIFTLIPGTVKYAFLPLRVFGDECWHPDSILTLTVFQSRRFFTLARPYIKYMLHSLQIFRHISCMVSILTI